MKIVSHPLMLASLTLVASLTACEKKTTPPVKPGGEHTHAASEVDDHGGNQQHGKPIELGTNTIGGYSVRAARDAGEIKSGGEAPIDVWLTGDLSKIVAVRFWIGGEDASGSVKAKAEIEDKAEPNHWHTHAEVPDPLPAGSKLWVELEIQGEGKKTAPFELATQ
jgi:hypothetical protein